MMSPIIEINDNGVCVIHIYKLTNVQESDERKSVWHQQRLILDHKSGITKYNEKITCNGYLTNIKYTYL